MRASVASLSSLSGLADSSARYKAKLSADKPVQVTLSKKFLSLTRDIVEVSEYLNVLVHSVNWWLSDIQC